MHLLLLASGLLNLVFGVVIIVYILRMDKLQKKLNYSETCLERADENNRRMLEAIDQANAQRHS